MCWSVFVWLSLGKPAREFSPLAGQPQIETSWLQLQVSTARPTAGLCSQLQKTLLHVRMQMTASSPELYYVLS